MSTLKSITGTKKHERKQASLTQKCDRYAMKCENRSRHRNSWVLRRRLGLQSNGRPECWSTMRSSRRTQERRGGSWLKKKDYGQETTKVNPARQDTDTRRSTTKKKKQRNWAKCWARRVRRRWTGKDGLSLETKDTLARRAASVYKQRQWHLTRRYKSKNPHWANAPARAQHGRQSKMQTPSRQATSHGAWNS